jgi:heme exporter protein D
MMDLGPHAWFIVTAYGAAAMIVAGMIAWVALDFWQQTRAIAALQARGATRRSEQRPDEVTT